MLSSFLLRALAARGGGRPGARPATKIKQLRRIY
jgi:hypothetical protein